MASKIFGKICPKAIRDTSFSIWDLRPGEGQGGLNYLVGVILNRRGKFKILGLQDKEILEEGSWYDYCNNFEKSKWEYFLSKQQIYSMQG